VRRRDVARIAGPPERGIECVLAEWTIGRLHRRKGEATIAAVASKLPQHAHRARGKWLAMFSAHLRAFRRYDPHSAIEVELTPLGVS
jgi:hypothetical protein